VKSNPPQLYPPKQDGVVGIFSKPHRKNVIIKRVENKNKKWLNTINILAKRLYHVLIQPLPGPSSFKKSPKKYLKKKEKKIACFFSLLRDDDEASPISIISQSACHTTKE
jgi:hypothetical protein